MTKQVYDAKWRKLSETIRHMTPYCEELNFIVFINKTT